jgi:hypothetical protein
VVSEGCRPRRRRRRISTWEPIRKRQRRAAAMFWFHRAAEQGHPVAKLYLGVMYAEGRGVPQDHVRAHMWISLSEAQGEKSCQDSRNDRTADDPSSGKRSAAAPTRLEPATQPTSLKECALRPVPSPAPAHLPTRLVTGRPSRPIPCIGTLRRQSPCTGTAMCGAIAAPTNGPTIPTGAGGR